MKKLFLALSLSFVSATCSLAQAQAPQVPPIEARNYILVDVTANQTLATRDADTPVEPASLTKLMSAYLVFQALRDGKLSLDQSLTVSERAWRTGMNDASRMFIQVGTQVKVEDLIKGMIVISGNDATVQLGEAVGGSLEGFVDMMNRQAQAWGLKNTAFKNADGLPAPGHLSTARELSVIATQLIRTFPEYMKYYSMKDFAYNIKRPQQNRNLLLWRDPSVDGLKTGYTDAAGYCLIATANRQLPNGARRLLSVVLGASSKEARAVESQKLLNWGYGAFDNVRLFEPGKPIVTPEVWKGAVTQAKLGAAAGVVVTVPKGEGQQLQTKVERVEPLVAPLAQGQRVGTVKVSTKAGTPVAEVPLVALEPVAQAGWLGRTWDALRLWIK